MFPEIHIQNVTIFNHGQSVKWSGLITVVLTQSEMLYWSFDEEWFTVLTIQQPTAEYH